MNVVIPPEQLDRYTSVSESEPFRSGMFAQIFASFLLPWLTILGLGAWIAGLGGAVLGGFLGLFASVLVTFYGLLRMETDQGRPRMPAKVKHQVEALIATLDLQKSHEVARIWRYSGRRAGLAWAIEVTPTGTDHELMSGCTTFTPVAQLVVSPSLPTAGTLRRLADGTHVLMCHWTMAVRVGPSGDPSSATRLYRVACEDQLEARRARPTRVGQVVIGPRENVSFNREIATYRSTLERAGLWDEMERLVFDQAPFALLLGIDDGAVVATLPLTRRLDPPMVERTAALLARWRGSLLGESAPAP